MVSNSEVVKSSPLPPEKEWSEGDYYFVQHLWDQVRNAAAYDHYFGREADRIARWNRRADIVVAVTAPSSLVSAWAFWNVTIPSLSIRGTMLPDIPVGHILWVTLGAIASIVSIIKPILRTDLLIASNTKLYTEFRLLTRSAEALVRSVRTQGHIDADIEDRQSKIDDRFASVDRELPAVIKDGLLKICRDKVLREYPSDQLWAPRVPGVHPRVLAMT